MMLLQFFSNLMLEAGNSVKSSIFSSRTRSGSLSVQQKELPVIYRAFIRTLSEAFHRFQSFSEIQQWFNSFECLVPPPSILYYSWSDVNADGVTCRWIESRSSCLGRPTVETNGVIVFMHGGGFAFGTLNVASMMGAEFARGFNRRVLVVDYRVSTKAPWPAAPDDCYTVWKWLIKQGYQPSDIVLVGDSAGGNLCLTTCLQIKRDLGFSIDEPTFSKSPKILSTTPGETEEPEAEAIPRPLNTPLSISMPSSPSAAPEPYPSLSSEDLTRLKDALPSGVVLLSAAVTLDTAHEYEHVDVSPDTPRTNQFDYLAERSGQMMLDLYIGSADVHHPLVSPMYSDLRGLPPMLVHCGGLENLAHAIRDFAAKGRKCGLNIQELCWEEGVHDFLTIPCAPEEPKQALLHSMNVFINECFERAAQDGPHVQIVDSSAILPTLSG